MPATATAGTHDDHISGAMVPALFSDHRPDVVVIDLQLPGAGGGGHQIVRRCGGWRTCAG